MYWECHLLISSKEAPSPGGVSYLLCSLIKNPEEEEPPRSTCYKLFEGVPVPPGSWSGNIVNMKLSRGGGVLSINIYTCFDTRLCICNLLLCIHCIYRRELTYYYQMPNIYTTVTNPNSSHSPMYAVYTRSIHICTGGTHMCTIGLYSPIYACDVPIVVQYTYVYIVDPPVNM